MELWRWAAGGPGGGKPAHAPSPGQASCSQTPRNSPPPAHDRLAGPGPATAPPPPLLRPLAVRLSPAGGLDDDSLRRAELGADTALADLWMRQHARADPRRPLARERLARQRHIGEFLVLERQRRAFDLPVIARAVEPL